MEKENTKSMKIERILYQIMYTIILVTITALATKYYLVGGSVAGIQFPSKKITIKQADEYEILYQNMKELNRVLEDKFRGEINQKKMLEYALKGYIAGLGDKYTEYYTKEEWQELQEEVSGRLKGIGVAVKEKEDEAEEYYKVEEVLKNTPAENADVKPGDKIVEVNGTDMKNKKLSEVIEQIKGEENTKVKIVFEREGNRIEKEITRQEIKVDSTTHKMAKDRSNIGYIKLESFTEESYNDFERAMEDLKSKGAEKLILDLRYNGGGEMLAAEKIIESLLGKEKVMYSTVDSKENKKVRKSKNEPKYKMPVIILANNYSASASELLIAALKDNDRLFKLIGKKTFGKGVIQTVMESRNGGALKVTTEEYFGPNGVKLNGVGIEPDIKVENTKRKEKDKALEKAIEEFEK